MNHRSSMQHPLGKSLQEYGRGIAGGLIFSLPLLYTMEVWWTGFNADSIRLMLYVLGTYVLLLGYNRFAGMRHDSNWAEVAIDSVEEMGLGIVISSLILFLLGRISPDMPLTEVMGKIVMESMIVAIGVSVGTAQLGGGEDEEECAGMEQGDDGHAHFPGQLIIATCGAFLFAANVGPTEEIVVLGVESSSLKMLGLALLSMAIGSMILYGTEFHGASRFASHSGTFSIVRGSIVTYAVAIATSALMLWFFGRFDGVALIPALKQTVVLAFPAALGASGGRLLLQVK